MIKYILFQRVETRHRAALLITALLAFVIAYMTLTPIQMRDGVLGNDKLYHLVAFGALALPVATLFAPAMVWVIPLCLAYGGAIELIQPSVGRSAEFADFIADTAGVFVGAALGYFVLRPLLGLRVTPPQV